MYRKTDRESGLQRSRRPATGVSPFSTSRGSPEPPRVPTMLTYASTVWNFALAFSTPFIVSAINYAYG